MRRFVMLTALVSAAALLIGVSRANSPRANSTKVDSSAPSRSLDFTAVIHVPAVPAGSHELRLWIPLPYEDAHQTVSNLAIQSPVKYHLEREPLYGDRYAYLDVSAARPRNLSTFD